MISRTFSGLAKRVIAACLLLAGAAHAGQWPPASYGVYWAVTGNPNQVPTIDPTWNERRVDLSGTRVNRGDLLFLYEASFGMINERTPHLMLQDPNHLNRHLNKVREHVQRDFPNPAANQMVVVNYEKWPVQWLFAKIMGYAADWERTVLAHRPQAIAGKTGDERDRALGQLWEEQTVTFFIETLNEIRRHRPNLKLSYYNYPHAIYFWPELGASPWIGPNGIIGYEDGSTKLRQANDQIQRLYDAMDFLAPSPYVFYWTVRDGVTPRADRLEDSIANARRFIATSVKEGIRVARGKPVYSVMWTRYHELFTKPWTHQHLTPESLRVVLDEPIRAGASGVIIWDFIDTPRKHNELIAWSASQMVPMLRELEPAMAQRDRPASGSGSPGSPANPGSPGGPVSPGPFSPANPPKGPDGTTRGDLVPIWITADLNDGTAFRVVPPAHSPSEVTRAIERMRQEVAKRLSGRPTSSSAAPRSLTPGAAAATPRAAGSRAIAQGRSPAAAPPRAPEQPARVASFGASSFRLLTVRWRPLIVQWQPGQTIALPRPPARPAPAPQTHAGVNPAD